MDNKNLTLGIIDPGDYLKSMAFGGSTGFIKNVLPYLNFKSVIIFGIGINDTVPWKETIIEKKIKFIPICKTIMPARYPMRLKCLVEYTMKRNKILKYNIDVLYVHSPECCIPFIYFNKDIPIIYQQHGSDNPVERSKYQIGRRKFFKKLFELMDRAIYRRSDWIIGIDNLCIKKAEKYGAGGKCTLLRNAVDTKKFRPKIKDWSLKKTNVGISDENFIILFVGRIEKTKGPELLIQCVPYFNKLKFNYHIYFAGEGTYKRQLNRFAINNNYEHNITFLGHISHDELNQYYNLADLLVLPSQAEGIPMVILEALACGTPVVASNVGGIPEIITDNFNGLILKDLSPKNIANAIISISRLNLSRDVIAQSMEKYSVNKFMLELDIIIKNIINKNK